MTAMTVGKLIDELQQYDANLPVRFAYNYGDHWHTTVAGIVGVVEEGKTTYSDYHSMDKVADDDADEAKCEQAIILSESGVL